MRVLGLDIGGANIKCSDADGKVATVPFEMWKRHQDLPDQIRKIADEYEPPDLVAITTTAELADCFQTKEEGVRYVLDSVSKAFPPRV